MTKAKNNDLIEEFIKDIRYVVKEDGTIFSGDTEIGYVKETEKNLRNKQYKYIAYKKKELKVHRIIYRKFHGELLKKKVIHHKDDNSLNNHKDNLEQVTQNYNMFCKRKNEKEEA